MVWYANRAHASSSGDAAQSQGMVDEFDRGAELLRIGRIWMIYTCPGLDFAQVDPNGTEMRDVWST